MTLPMGIQITIVPTTSDKVAAQHLMEELGFVFK